MPTHICDGLGLRYAVLSWCRLGGSRWHGFRCRLIYLLHRCNALAALLV